MQRNDSGPSARLGFSALVLASTLGSLQGCVLYLDGSLDVGDDDVDSESSESDTGDEDDGTDTAITVSTGDEDPTDETGSQNDECVEQVDILFVIDNSGSMGDKQIQMVGAIGSLVGALDNAGLDWRIGVTTTDNGNPWCPAGSTTPEGGRLVASSCRSRLGDFLFSDTVDVQDSACNDICNHGDVALASNVIDGEVRPGAWVERTNGMANTFTHEGDELVPLDPIEALQCILPQGVNGCGFESQLDSMELALVRAMDENEDQYGFLRARAQLVVVIVTDETDCSYNKNWSDIFAQDGNKTFWTDPNASFPTSGVCWNAGMVCSGEGPEYANCVAANKDIDGNILPAGNDPDAVLNPIARYSEFLTALEESKQMIEPSAEVMVFGIVGVDIDGSISFRDVSATDPEYQDSFGIGPGCEAEAQVMGDPKVSAVPPGRMREVVNLSGGTMHSVCKPQYIDALTTIANRVTFGCG